MAQLVIKNLSKIAPFAGGPWNLPQQFHLYLIYILGAIPSQNLVVQSSCESLDLVKPYKTTNLEREERATKRRRISLVQDLIFPPTPDPEQVINQIGR